MIGGNNPTIENSPAIPAPKPITESKPQIKIGSPEPAKHQEIKRQIGAQEQKFIDRIKQDGDPAIVLEDIAKPEIPQTSKEFDPGETFSEMYSAADRTIATFNNRWDTGKSEAVQNYVSGYERSVRLRVAQAVIDVDRAQALKYAESDPYIKEILDLDDQLGSMKDNPVENPNDDPNIIAIQKKIAMHPRRLERDIMKNMIDPESSHEKDARVLLTEISKHNQDPNLKFRDYTKVQTHFDPIAFDYWGSLEKDIELNVLDINGEILYEKYVEQFPKSAQKYKDFQPVAQATKRLERQNEFINQGGTLMKDAVRRKQEALGGVENQSPGSPNELELVESEEEIAQRLKEQIPQYTKEATDEELDTRRQTLRDRPQLSGFTLKDTLVGLPKETQFAWVQVDKIVGRTMKTYDGWSDEIEARQGRVVQVARNLIDSNAQNIEEIFHPATPMERIKVTQIPGPSGPMYYVDDGTHRVSGAMTAGVKEIPCEVREIKYPLEHIAPIDPDKQRYQIYEWEKLIELGLVDGKVIEHAFSDGTKGKKLVVQKEVLPWIRSSQGDLIEISRVYEQLYPGSLDNLPIPKEALLDPIANNFYRAGRFEELKAIDAKEKSSGSPVVVTEKNTLTPETAKTNTTPENSSLSEQERRFLEISRNVGKVYSSMVNEYIGNGTTDQEVLNSLPPNIKTRIEAIATSVKTHQTEQDKAVQQKNLTAADLLKQYGEKFTGILPDPSKYNVRRLGTGMYRVDMDYESFRKIFQTSNANAVAARPKEGIPFIVTRRPRSGEERTEEDPYLQENIPHEVHHIIWSNAQKDGTIDTSETDPFAKRAFLDFQDEVLARAVSNGKLHGNTILSGASDEQRKALEAKYPDAVQKVKDISPKLNAELEILDNRLKDNSAVRKSDLLLTFMSAGNFAELQTNIRVIKGIVDKTSSKSESTVSEKDRQEITQLDII